MSTGADRANVINPTEQQCSPADESSKGSEVLKKLEHKPSFARRIVISAVIGLVSGLLCFLVLSRFQIAAGDFTWSIRAAADLVSGRDPYAYAPGEYAIPYPLTAAFAGLPFIAFPYEIGGALFFGLSTALLAFGLARESYTRLLIFLAYPYWGCLIAAQWPPLLMAAALFPMLLPLTMIKPQIGLPIALTHLTRRGVLLCVAFGLLTLAAMPNWPFRWLSQISDYQRFIPFLILPGPLLLLALLRYRSRDAQFLLIASMVPQRWFYDGFMLWLIPRTTREILVTAVLSWGTAIWRWNVTPSDIEQVGLVSVLCLYLPMLGVVLLRKSSEAQSLFVRRRPDVTSEAR